MQKICEFYQKRVIAKFATNEYKEFGEDKVGSPKSYFEQICSNQPRLLVDFDISAPIVIIPRTPTDTAVLLIDFGELSLSNRTVKLREDPIVELDEISINLTRTNIARYIYIYIYIYIYVLYIYVKIIYIYENYIYIYIYVYIYVYIYMYIYIIFIIICNL